MPQETRTARSPYFAYPRLQPRSYAEALRELQTPCYRFKAPFSTEDKLLAFIAERSQDFDVFRREKTLFMSGIPLNWQYIVDFLYKNNVIRSRELTFHSLRNDRPKFFNISLGLAQGPETSDGWIIAASGFGAAFSREEALSKAVGETLERHFLTRYRRSDFKRASFASLRSSRTRVLDLHALNSFLPWQKRRFPQFDWNDESEFSWVVGEEISSGAKTMLPAQLVFWNYQHAKEKALARISTSGCAGHFSREEAILSGLLENIQRDGFLVHWLNRLSPRVLSVSESEAPEIQKLLEYLSRYRLRATFLDTTTDVGIPSLACVITDLAAKEPVVSVGGACGFDLRHMLMQSALEALIIGDYTDRHAPHTLLPEYRPFADPTIDRHARLTMWKGEKMLRRFSFFTSGKPRSLRDFMRGLETVEEKHQLPYVLGRLRTLGDGYEAYVYEARSPVLRTLGYHAVRTIVPRLMPLYLAEFAAPLDSRRLREVPKKIGYTATDDYVPWPHPFP